MSLVCLGYALWIVLDASFWYYYSPNIVPTIIKFNGVKLLYGEVLCLLFTLGQWKALKTYSSHRVRSTAGAAGTAILFAFILAFLSDLQSHYWQTGTMVIQIFQTFGRVLFATVIVTCGLLGLFYVSYYRKITAQQQEQLIRAKALADEAQLLMLRYQINPHFLFNSLNAIQSMIEKDKDQAKDMIADLSDFFRYTLSKNNQSLVPLKEELDAIRNYLAIQKERFIDRLEVRYEIEDSVLQIQLPFFLIHPLVENAVKYGFGSSHDDMHILIKASRTGQKLVLLVRNTGHLLTSEETNAISAPGTKTGIENIKKRLSLFYPDSSSFELFEQDQCVHARITITHPSMTA
jgi:sensor histidine kinase YesM